MPSTVSHKWHNATIETIISETNFRDTATWAPPTPHHPRGRCLECGLFRDSVQFCSGLVDLVVGAGDHGGGGHRLALAGKRFVGFVAEDIARWVIAAFILQLQPRCEGVDDPEAWLLLPTIKAYQHAARKSSRHARRAGHPCGEEFWDGFSEGLKRGERTESSGRLLNGSRCSSHHQSGETH